MRDEETIKDTLKELGEQENDHWRKGDIKGAKYLRNVAEGLLYCLGSEIGGINDATMASLAD